MDTTKSLKELQDIRSDVDKAVQEAIKRITG